MTTSIKITNYSRLSSKTKTELNSVPRWYLLPLRFQSIFGVWSLFNFLSWAVLVWARLTSLLSFCCVPWIPYLLSWNVYTLPSVPLLWVLWLFLLWMLWGLLCSWLVFWTGRIAFLIFHPGRGWVHWLKGIVRRLLFLGLFPRLFFPVLLFFSGSSQLGGFHNRLHEFHIVIGVAVFPGEDYGFFCFFVYDS